jgi:dolichol-phosphate mannosyltransferase
MTAHQSGKAIQSISFIVPALNEEIVLERVLREVHSTIDALVATYEFILVDDGSTDRTGEIMERLAGELAHVRVLHNPLNIGIGGSYRRGLAEANHDYVMMLCGDGGLPAASLPLIIEKAGSADIVVPYILNLKQIKTPFRYFVSRAYTALINLISGYRLRYYNGLPLHRRDLVSRLTISSAGFGVQSETIVKLLKSGCTFTEVGVMGAEATRRSSALRLTNILSVATTIASLLITLRMARWRRIIAPEMTPISENEKRPL